MKLTEDFAPQALFVLIVLICTMCCSSAAAKEIAFPAMAPLSEYLMSTKAEIALARSAAPPSISAKATVMALGRDGYSTAIKGSNGFLCLVERSWGNATTDAEFWNPNVRGPICFNPAAARTFAPIYLMKTKLVLTGETKDEIARTLASAFNEKELPELAPGAMSYMTSRQQRIGDEAIVWHPHLMFYVRGDTAKTWGGNLPGSPLIATNDPEERATIFMVLVGRWSDGTPASQAAP
ncbi:MAG: hypothetical protein V4567_13170 [Pseudomonadota bacterium]